MRQFFRDMWATMWLFIWLAVGIYFTAQVLRWLNGAQWQELVDSTFSQIQGIDSVETAVRVIGTLFAGTWGVRLLDRTFFRGRIIKQLGFKPSAPSLLQLFAFSFIHGNDNHLFGNTLYLLVFAGVMAFLVPSMQAFLIASVVVLLIAAIGFIIFAPKESNTVGASFILMGYYSFDIIYGFFALGPGGTVAAWLLLIFFGRQSWRTLRASGGNVSQTGHIWGFIGGVFSAAALVRLGYV